MYIAGYAYKPEAEKITSHRRNLAKVAKTEGKSIVIDRRIPGYNKIEYEGHIEKGTFTEEELAAVCCGSMPFGGSCVITSDKFNCVEFTD